LGAYNKNRLPFASNPPNAPPGPLPHRWLGFNAGSAIAAGYDASRAFLNTHLAASAGIAGFAAAEALWGGARGCCRGRWGRGQPSAVGAATGVIVGLVAITPACGFVSQMAALCIGFTASLLAYPVEHSLRHVTGVEDVLNAFSGHGIGGLLGIIGVGLFASTAEDAPVDGLFRGNASLLGTQLLGVLVCVVTAAVGTTAAWALVCAGFWAAGASPLIAPECAEDVDRHLLKGEYAWDLGGASTASSALN
jgi:Amt family ammonium transporter